MVTAKDQSGISGINKGDTRVALTKKEIEQEKRELRSILNMGMPLTEDQRNRIINKITGVTPITDASKSNQYSDTVTIDGKTFENRRGAGYGGGVEVDSGIKTPAPETKVRETTRMAGGFFSPQNFQRSGVPDATIMTGEQMRQSIFGDPGYKRFGTLDREGTQAAKDTAAFNERVKSNFFSPIKADPRSIAERREANEQSMRDTAAENYQAFKDRGGRPAPTTRISGDDTYGTNVMSNPAFGFRSQMSAENQKRYDSSAAEATRRSEVEPSKGNLITSVTNAMKRGLNTVIGADQGTAFTKEVKLEKRGEAEQRRYEKYLNRPQYQKEATARQEAGITNAMTIAKNKAQVRADAAARNEKFQADKRSRAVERSVRRQTGMPSNPQSQRQTGVGVSANDLSRHSPGTSKDQPKNTPQQAVKKAQTQKEKSGGGFGGGVGNPTNRRGSGVSGRRGGTSRSSGTSGSKSSSRGARGSAGSRSRGGSGSRGGSTGGSKSSSRGARGSAGSRSRGGTSSSSRRGGIGRRGRRGGSRRCDIRCKYDIMPLTNMNLIRDDLAEVAYFVKEIQK